MMEQPKYTLRHIDKAEGRCKALSFYCKNPDCDYEYDPNDRTTDVCPKCGRLRQVCGKYPIKGRTRCSRHGGKVPMGIESSNYKGRSLSKHLPTRFLEQYQLIERDPHILEMSNDVQLLEMRKVDLLSRLDQAGGSKLWQQAQQAFAKFTKARSSGSAKAAEQMAEQLSILEKILIRGYGESLIWQELQNIMEQQRRLRESEIKRRKEAASIVTEADVKSMIAFILTIIKDRVKDQKVRAEILNDMQAMNVN